jgi:hypothetical protein
VHGVVAYVAVFAVDDNGLGSDVSIDLGVWSMVALTRTSRPFCATICAVQKDGSPKKVMVGLEPVFNALRRRRAGFTSLVAVGGDILAFDDQIGWLMFEDSIDAAELKIRVSVHERYRR